jgi:DNA-binding GntR family transcriptional regulator
MDGIAASGGAWPEMADADVSLHETLVALSGSQRLQRMYATLAAESRMCLYRYPPYSQTQNMRDHEEIVRALEAGDPAASGLVREHLRFSARLAADWLRERE